MESQQASLKQQHADEIEALKQQHEEALKECEEKYGCEVVGLDEIYEVDANVYCPCALGATVNDDTIEKYLFEIIFT